MSEHAPAAPVVAPEVPAAPAPDIATLIEGMAALRTEIAAIAELARAKAEAPAAPVVPTTETPPPAITPKVADTSGLPIYARLAAGYAK